MDQMQVMLKDNSFEELKAEAVIQIIQKLGLNNFIDLSFPPQMSSIYNASLMAAYPLKCEVHWRRVQDFLGKGRLMKQEIELFYQGIEPNDVRQGSLGDCWFLCSLASLAERPKLIENLFITKKSNSEGVYRIRFCKNGEWVEVTIDDYIPCQPMSGPIFCNTHG